MIDYKSWVVPAGVGSALADMLGAEFRQIIDFVLERGGGGLCGAINLFFGGRGGGLRGSNPGVLWVITASSLSSLSII